MTDTALDPGPPASRTRYALLALGCAVFAVTIPLYALLWPTHTEVSAEIAATMGPHGWLMVALPLLQALVLFFARVSPLGAFIGVVGIALLGSLLVDPAKVSFCLVAVAVATYVLMSRRPVRSSLLMIVATGVVLALVINVVYPGFPLRLILSVPQILIVLGVPFFVARYVGANRQVVELSRQREKRALQDRQTQIDQAIESERTSMARELHDVAAHHLSGIVVMASAVERLVDVNPEQAKVHLGELRHQGDLTLSSLRQVVGLLRDTGEERHPAASLSQIPALVEAIAKRGTSVVLTVTDDQDGTGTEAEVGTLGGICAYRMVQESLANAAIHAPGAACQVDLDYTDPEWVSVRVTNDAPAVGPLPSERSGLGLVGMRERADLAAAALEYGPTDTGGWQVTLRLPRLAKQ